jgi:hypothetical protein
MYVLLLSAFNLVSSLVKMYVCPDAVLGLTFASMLQELSLYAVITRHLIIF